MFGANRVNLETITTRLFVPVCKGLRTGPAQSAFHKIINKVDFPSWEFHEAGNFNREEDTSRRAINYQKKKLGRTTESSLQQKAL